MSTELKFSLTMENNTMLDSEKKAGAIAGRQNRILVSIYHVNCT
jgi:hypothetical protein